MAKERMISTFAPWPNAEILEKIKKISPEAASKATAYADIVQHMYFHLETRRSLPNMIKGLVDGYASVASAMYPHGDTYFAQQEAIADRSMWRTGHQMRCALAILMDIHDITYAKAKLSKKEIDDLHAYRSKENWGSPHYQVIRDRLVLEAKGKSPVNKNANSTTRPAV